MSGILSSTFQLFLQQSGLGCLLVMQMQVFLGLRWWPKSENWFCISRFSQHEEGDHPLPPQRLVNDGFHAQTDGSHLPTSWLFDDNGSPDAWTQLAYTEVHIALPSKRWKMVFNEADHVFFLLLPLGSDIRKSLTPSGKHHHCLGPSWVYHQEPTWKLERTFLKSQL